MSINRFFHAILSLSVIILMGLAPGHVRAQSINLADGEELFELCAGCHGEEAEGYEDMGPRLNGQRTWYLRAQIKKFRSGFRGYNEDEDDTGVMMRDVAQGLEDEQSIENVLAYIATMKLVAGEKTLEGGDAEKGKTFWTSNCTFCHGEDAMGRYDIGAPRLAGQSDWYLVKQINSFRAGLRGTHKEDPKGNMMQAMSLVLPDEQAVLDVITYLSRMQ